MSLQNLGLIKCFQAENDLKNWTKKWIWNGTWSINGLKMCIQNDKKIDFDLDFDVILKCLLIWNCKEFTNICTPCNAIATATFCVVAKWGKVLFQTFLLHTLKYVELKYFSKEGNTLSLLTLLLPVTNNQKCCFSKLTHGFNRKWLRASNCFLQKSLSIFQPENS